MVLKTIGQKVKSLTGEDRGVSPVIGVILMVAITVILAAVIGAFVLNLGNGLDASQTPTASVNAEVIPGGEGVDDDVRFTHQNGDSIDPSNLYIVAGDRTAIDTTVYTDSTFGSGSTIDVSGHKSLAGYKGSVSLVYDNGEASHSLATIDVDNSA